MGVAKTYRTISYLKNHATDVAREIAETSATVVITQNGVPSFVCVSMEEYYCTRESNALVKLISLGRLEERKGNARLLLEARGDLDKRILAGRYKRT